MKILIIFFSLLPFYGLSQEKLPFNPMDEIKDVMIFQLEKDNNTFNLSFIETRKQFAPSNLQSPSDITIKFFSSNNKLLNHLNIIDPCLLIKCEPDIVEAEEVLLSKCQTFIGVLFNPDIAYALIIDNQTGKETRINLNIKK